MLAPPGAQELPPTRARPPGGRPESSAGEQPTDRRWRYPEPELGELTADPPMAPARILACQPQHQGPHLRLDSRASAPNGRLAPLSAHERPMPPQERPRSDQTCSARGGWQIAGRRREHGPISRAKLRRRALAAQHRDLVAQDQQLEVLGVQATATPNECAQQGPERDIEEGEGHHRDPPNPPTKGATRVLAPYRHPHSAQSGTKAWRGVSAVSHPRVESGAPGLNPRAEWMLQRGAASSAVLAGLRPRSALWADPVGDEQALHVLMAVRGSASEFTLPRCGSRRPGLE
jgi:hypothetical protein